MKRLFLLFCFTAGCTDDLTPSSQVDKLRILAAQVRAGVEGAAAWPLPGERVEVAWLLGHPAEARPVNAALAVCEAGLRSEDFPGCASPPFVVEQSDPSPTPTFSFQVPESEQAWSNGRLTMFFAACSEGVPFADLDGFQVRCEPAGRAVSALLEVRVADNDVPNMNPPEPQLQFGGDIWEPLTGQLPPWDACRSDESALPTARAGGADPAITLLYPEGARERSIQGEAVQGETEQQEELLISHFTTLGAMSRKFSVLDADAPEGALLEVEWDVSEDQLEGKVGAEGALTRFYFITRDQQGGVSWAERYACLLPAD